ncbi:MAG: HAMP domain-containing sensor histidine kinase [Polyangiaceae bacterium]
MPPNKVPAARSPSSLALRVALGTAASAAVVALLAAGVSLLVAEKLIDEAEDTRLRTMADIAAAEIPRDGTAGALDEAIAHEEEELARVSIRVAVRRGPTLVRGDPRLPAPPSGSCASESVENASLRVCAVEAPPFQVVTGAISARRSKMPLLVSSLVAALVAAVGAAFFGARAARWALEPLMRLGKSLDRIAVDDPRAVVVAGDDTCREIATLRAALGSLLTRLADALDAARNFSAEAAHELKTPLTVIRAELDLLSEEPLDAAPRDAVERVLTRVTALSTLVERLLTFATAGDQSRLTKEAVAIEDVARDVIARLAPIARARVRLQADAPGMVLGDETLLSTLVENAADNALKFSGDRPVEIDVKERGAEVLLDVRDYGPGIPAADRERAFEPFFRTPASRGANTPGHGVGLALVARIAGAHGGAAEFVDVGPGERGARLRVVLPGWSPRGAS